MLLDALQSRILLRTAAERKFAILAVNADAPSALYDCLAAAKRCDAPVIVETSLWQLRGRSFGAGDAARGMTRYLADLAILAASDEFASVPVVYHTDHIKGPETMPLLESAIAGLPLRVPGARPGEASEIRLRPSTISLDSSELGDEQNIAHLRRLAAHAERLGVPVTLEMEAGVDDGVTAVEVTERLVRGVEERHPGHLYLFAPGVGTRHGFSADGYPSFSVDAIARHRDAASAICGRPVGIALHGSSGLSDAQLASAVASGVVKVNWSTDSLHARSRLANAYWHDAGARLERAHKDFKATAMDNGVATAVGEAYVAVVAERMGALGGHGAGAHVRAALGLGSSRAASG